MILPVLKYCLPIYVLLAFGFVLAVKHAPIDIVGVLVLAAIIAAITVLGLILGMILSVLIRKPRHERVFYAIGQLIAFVLVLTPFVKAWYHLS